MTPSNKPVPRGRVRRTMPLAGFTARAAAGRLVAGLRERAGDQGAVERFHERTADRYTDLLGASKGALMKAGQILSMIDANAIGNGGFGPYQKALSRLQADAPPMPAALVRTILRDELGTGIDRFAEFDDRPIAAASVGQVHRAALQDGREVAVKIQYPGVAGAIRDDLANTELLTTFIRFVMAASGMTADLRGMVAELSARITEELDYRHEAAMITKFADLYRAHPFIRVPEVVTEASGDHVLTMTYLDGLDWVTAQRADQDLKNIWAEVIYRFINGNGRHGSMAQVDPHPGNFRFFPDGTVGFLDFGCVQVADDERQRWLYVAMQRAGLDGRYEDCRELMVEMGALPRESPLSESNLRQLVDEMLDHANQPQPMTFTPDITARNVRTMFGDQNFVPASYLAITREFVFMPRIAVAFGHIAAGLTATVHVRSILDDLDGVAEPTTELGKLHHAWVCERGLPLGLDHHDHP